MVWRCSGTWSLSQRISNAHSESVTALTSFTLADGTLLLVSASADCTVKLWIRSSSAPFAPQQTITCGVKPVEAIALQAAPGMPSLPVLVAGGVDHLVHLYVWESASRQLRKALSLTGHTDWIRALSCCTADNGDVLLASASQDHYVCPLRHAKQ